ncbi:MAG: hypothetical protein LQ338_001961 [Usnochroma carphineum]|nr:MAG: hypothetical protein LQ338_001961 [Usnochroma carphineum]
MSTPPPSLSSIEYYAENFSLHHPVKDEVDSTSSRYTAVDNMPESSIQLPKARPKPIVRLPPSGSLDISQQNHTSNGQSRSRSTRPDLPTWQERFDDLLADRDPVLVEPPNGTVVQITDVEPPGDSLHDDAVSSAADGDQPEIPEVQRSGRKKRRRRRAGKNWWDRKPESDSENEQDASQPQSAPALGHPPHPPTPALLLHAARLNWENICHLLMGEVNRDDREILKQIVDLVSRLGTANDPTKPTYQLSPAKLQAVPLPRVSTESTALAGLCTGDQAVPDSPEGSQDSFYSAVEDCAKDGADEDCYLEQTAFGVSQAEGQSGSPAMPQEDENERHARLERIASRLVMIRKEQPVEERLRR